MLLKILCHYMASKRSHLYWQGSKTFLYILRHYLVIVHLKFTLILGKYIAYLRQAHRCFICLNSSCFIGQEIACNVTCDVRHYGQKKAFKGVSISFFWEREKDLGAVHSCCFLLFPFLLYPPWDITLYYKQSDYRSLEL